MVLKVCILVNVISAVCSGRYGLAKIGLGFQFLLFKVSSDNTTFFFYTHKFKVYIQVPVYVEHQFHSCTIGNGMWEGQLSGELWPPNAVHISIFIGCGPLFLKTVITHTHTHTLLNLHGCFCVYHCLCVCVCANGKS